ncbi:MAG: ATP-dependent helicase [Proteobacteria bacterium]|nr:ATP-dependent helicase [Pseudomonadota bacterium]
MNISKFTLNENQRVAVEWTEGPLLVLAGPGSGKTLVLTLRAARLLQGDPEASVLALTFTTKAADEMRERLDKLMGGRADRAHLCTFHSFAGDILRQHGSHVGIQPAFSLLTLDDDRVALLEILLAETPNLPLNGEKPYSERLQIVHNKLKTYTASIPNDRKNLLVLLDHLFAESYDGTPKAAGLTETPPWVPELFEAYCMILQERNRLDYGGLLHFARNLLSQNAGVARLTRLAWRFICVDEFQDTNRAQYDLLRLLISEQRQNLFVVADDDQIIYQWNGASPERLLALRDDFGMEVVQLPENFRCPPIIVQIANNLIGHNRTRTADKQPLVARKPAEDSDVLKARVFRDEDEEVAAISTMIQEMGWRAEDCAVLARATKLLQKAAQSLEQNGFVPYLAQRKNEFECDSIRWMHAALRLANARHDREFLRRICVAWQAFTGAVIELEAVEAIATLSGGDFLRAWIDDASESTSDDKLCKLLSKLRGDLADRLLFVNLLEWFWDQEWLDDPLECEELNTWKELHGAVMREHSPDNVTLHLYLQEMDMKSKVTARLPGSIPCLTVHGAKGLEFKHVFLIGMADEVFPSYQAVRKGSESREMEEERRNCFVAITRVQETLHISWARSYNRYNKRPSRFIEEMGFRIQKS